MLGMLRCRGVFRVTDVMWYVMVVGLGSGVEQRVETRPQTCVFMCKSNRYLVSNACMISYSVCLEMGDIQSSL